MTEQERKQRIQQIKQSARETDAMAARSMAALELALARLDKAVERLVQSR